MIDYTKYLFSNISKYSAEAENYNVLMCDIFLRFLHFFFFFFFLQFSHMGEIRKIGFKSQFKIRRTTDTIVSDFALLMVILLPV